MNYLAHAYLSSHNDELLIGNFIADHLRGNNFNYSEGITAGIVMHRSIDSFTDSHPNYRKAKRFFYNGFEKYSGILVDIYFDHLLAKNFEQYSAIPLKTFSDRIYRIYRQHEPVFPTGSSRFLDYVISNRIYESYATEAGIQTVLMHLSRRIRHNVQLHESFSLMKDHLQELTSLFVSFFGELRLQFPGNWDNK